MTNITPGTGGTIKSLTAEGQLLEVIDFIKLAEKDVTKNITSKVGVTGNYNINSSFFNGGFDIDCTRSLNAQGQSVISPTNYFTNLTFTSGTGGTFKSSNPIAYLYEVATFLEFGEALQTGDSPKNYISTTLTGDDNKITATINTPITITIQADGSRKIEALAYLV